MSFSSQLYYLTQEKKKKRNKRSWPKCLSLSGKYSVSLDNAAYGSLCQVFAFQVLHERAVEALHALQSLGAMLFKNLWAPQMEILGGWSVYFVHLFQKGTGKVSFFSESEDLLHFWQLFIGYFQNEIEIYFPELEFTNSVISVLCPGGCN